MRDALYKRLIMRNFSETWPLALILLLVLAASGIDLLADLQQLAELVQEQLHTEGLGPAAAADWLRRLRLVR